MKKHFSIAFILFTVLLFSRSASQILDSGTPPKTGTFSSIGGAYYNFSGGTGCDLKVSVWGFVNSPGRYYIPCETNLLELLSFCGGPRKGADLERVKIVRRGGVDRENELKEVFKIDLSKYLELTDQSIISPELLLFPGDLVIIEGEEVTAVDWFLRAAQLVVAITSIVTAAIAVINIAK